MKTARLFLVAALLAVAPVLVAGSDDKCRYVVDDLRGRAELAVLHAQRRLIGVEWQPGRHHLSARHPRHCCHVG